MKTSLLLLFVFFFIGFGSHAQIERGTNVLGGEFNFSTNNAVVSSRIVNKTTNFQIAPNIGRFIRKNVAIGLRLAYSGQRFKSVDNTAMNSGYTTKSSDFAVESYSRAYQQVSEKFSLFGQASIGVGFGRSRQDAFGNTTYGTSKEKNTSLNVNVRPGIVYFITKRLGLEATYGYIGYKYAKNTSLTYPDNPAIHTNSFAISLSPSSLNIGLQYYFCR